MKAFLFDAETEYEFDDLEDNEDTDLETALEEFYYLSDHEGSFMGFRTPDGRIVQFAWEKADIWLVDIPEKDNPEEFFQRNLSYENCVEIIRKLYNGIATEDLKRIIALTPVEPNNTDRPLPHHSDKNFMPPGWDEGIPPRNEN